LPTRVKSIIIKPGFKLQFSRRYLRQSRHKEEQDGLASYWDIKKGGNSLQKINKERWREGRRCFIKWTQC
jgi:hypothetical protein